MRSTRNGRPPSWAVGVFLTMFIINCANGICTDGWREYNQHCYKFVDQYVQQTAAKEGCRQQGAQLGSIGSRDENEYIRDLLPRRRYAWIGLELNPFNVWTWQDGSSTIGFEFFKEDEPGPDEECVRIQENDGLWYGYYCDANFQYVCEKDASTGKLPFFCGFDTNNCSITQDTNDNGQWTVLSNTGTPSVETGPDRGYNGSAGFIYYEASYRSIGEISRFAMPPLRNERSLPCVKFEFYYHMYGESMGTLRVYTRNGSDQHGAKLWLEVEGNQGNNWIKYKFDADIDSNTILVFEAVRGNDFTSDIAVDAINITECIGAGSCQVGWGEHNQNCYKHVDQQISHTRAKEKCHQLGAHLVSIGSREENEYILGLLPDGSQPWIGMEKSPSGNWAWPDGSSTKVFELFNEDEPGPDEECVRIRQSDGLWYGFNCDATFTFVCEKDTLRGLGNFIIRARLVGGTHSNRGRLEVLHLGQWGTVCDDGFGETEASMFCRMMGLSNEGYVLGHQYGPSPGTIWLDNVSCPTGAVQLTDCTHNELGVHDCNQYEDVSMGCRQINASCGVQDIQPNFRVPNIQITGGSEAIPHSWPWQVNMQVVNRGNQRHQCGAVVINEEWIVTAAHCVYGVSLGDMIFLLGDHSENILEASQRTHNAIDVITHSSYRHTTSGTSHDISLVKVDPRIEYNTKIQPICLPTEPVPEDYTCVTSGWGFTAGK